MEEESTRTQMQETKSSKILELLVAYLPAILAGICAIATVVLYTKYSSSPRWEVIFDQIFMCCVQFVIDFLNRWLKLGLPYYLVALMALHAVLSVDMGTSLGFYGRYSWWDSSVHCFFGLLAAATLYYLYPRIKGKEANAFDALVIFLIVLAFAAIWELFEYVAGIIFNSDMQDAYRLTGDIVNHINEARAAGSTADMYTLMREMPNPVSDTMFDMTVAIIGAAVFFAILYPVRFIKKIIQKKLS